MTIDIKSYCNGAVLYSAEANSLKEAMEKAVAQRVKLDDADLEMADLEGANLCGADLSWAKLNRANLGKARLDWASLDRANFYGANLEGSSLHRANLERANLKGANLGNAILSEAILNRANLYGANLEGANLCGASWTGAILRRAILNENTRLPTGETFATYKSVVLPALCTAGGKTLEEVAAAWACHTWSNCPMHVAFDCDGIFDTASDLAILLRPRIAQFVQLFDARLLPDPPTGAVASCAGQTP